MEPDQDRNSHHVVHNRGVTDGTELVTNLQEHATQGQDAVEKYLGREPSKERGRHFALVL